MAASKISPQFLASLADVQSEETTPDRLTQSRNVQDNPLSSHLAQTYDNPAKVSNYTIPGRAIRDDNGRITGHEEDRESWVGTPRHIKTTAASAKGMHDLMRRAAAAQKVGSTMNFLDKNDEVIPRPALPGFKDAEGVRKLAANTTVWFVFAAKEKTVRTRSTDDEFDEFDDADDADDAPTE